MVNREFSDLPIEYQAGCRAIEKQCRELFKTVKIQFDEIYWDKLNMHSCHLFVKIANKEYSIKFGKKALTHQQEAGMMQSINVRLQNLIREIKLAY